MKLINKLLIAGACFSFAACEKTLDKKPEAALDASLAFTTRAGVEAGLIGIYDGLQNNQHYGLNLWIFADMYADNISHTGTFPTYSQIFNKQLLADNVDVQNFWYRIYNTINRANNIIDAAPKINDPAFNKAGALGEARCLRALCYFDLLRFFGGSNNGYNKSGGIGVPLYLKPTLASTDAAPKAKSTEAEVYTQIQVDLDSAINNLAVTSSNGRVNKVVAQSLKARLELYRENFADAEALSTAVINLYTASPNGGLVAGADFATLWLNKNIKPESIFELQYFADDGNSGAFYYYPTANGGRNEITTAAGLRTAHETGDLRLAINNTTAVTGIPANKTRKFSRVDGSDNVILIRLAELFLIRAEARIRKATPDLTGATADINRIRSRAGLANTTATTAADLLLAVERERRIELAHEGHRWPDLRRYDKVSSVGITQAFRALWPVPLREVQTSNGVIAQNPSY
jgi:starch-binding outer membrane protein, SusD/RagB family